MMQSLWSLLPKELRSNLRAYPFVPQILAEKTAAKEAEADGVGL
jgi:hypothetical protein